MTVTPCSLPEQRKTAKALSMVSLLSKDVCTDIYTMVCTVLYKEEDMRLEATVTIEAIQSWALGRRRATSGKPFE